MNIAIIDVDKFFGKLIFYVDKWSKSRIGVDTIRVGLEQAIFASKVNTESTLPINPSKDESFGRTTHKKVCEELNELYKNKNSDYGDSFHLTFVDEGMAMVRIRLSDKLNRLKILTKGGAVQKVSDESVRDTLMDLANYAIMAIMEIDNGNTEK